MFDPPIALDGEGSAGGEWAGGALATDLVGETLDDDQVGRDGSSSYAVAARGAGAVIRPATNEAAAALSIAPLLHPDGLSSVAGGTPSLFFVFLARVCVSSAFSVETGFSSDGGPAFS